MNSQFLGVASVVLTLAALSLALGGVFTANPSVDSTEVLAGLSAYYYLGFFCVVLGFSLQIARTRYSVVVLVFQTLLVEVYLWGLPIIFGGGLMFPAGGHDLGFYAETASILSTGHLDPSVYLYQTFPGEFLLFALLKSLVPITGYLQFYQLAPLAMNLFVSLVVFIFLRSHLGSKYTTYVFLGVILFELLNFSELFTTITPFAIGSLLFYGAVFPFLAMHVAKGFITSRRHTVVSFLFVASLSVTHPLFALEAASAISAIHFYEYLKTGTQLNSFLLFISGSLITIGAWAVFYGGSPAFWAPTFQSWSNLVFSLFGSSVQALSQPSAAYLFVIRLKLLILVALFAGALPALVSGIRSKECSIQRVFWMLIGLAAVAIFGAAAQGPTYDVYLVGMVLPAFVLLDILTLRRLPLRVFKVATIIILALSLSVGFVSIYGNVPTEGISTSGIVASVFMSEFLTPTSIDNFHTYVGTYLGYYGPNLASVYPFVSRTSPEGQLVSVANMNLANKSSIDAASPQMVILGSFASDTVNYAIGNSTLVPRLTTELSSDSRWQIVYSSHMTTIFSKHNQFNA